MRCIWRWSSACARRPPRWPADVGLRRGGARDAQRARQVVDEGTGLSLQADGDDLRRRFRRMLTEETTIVPYDNPDGDEVFVALTKRPTADVLAEYLGEREALCRRLEGSDARRMAPQGQAPAVPALRPALPGGIHGPPRSAPHLSAVSASRAVREAASLMTVRCDRHGGQTWRRYGLGHCDGRTR